MSEKVIIINEETFIDFAKEAPNSSLAMLYALSRYHEKYKVTEWCMKLLTSRGFTKEHLKDFDKSFIDFYDQMIQQNDL
jgi:hypothetical protein